MIIEHIYISPKHNYFGHYGKPAGTEPAIEVAEAEIVAGKGIRGDRFFGYKEDYKGQVTFFSKEIYEELCAQFSVWDRPASSFRRNIIVSGVDLNSLIGQEFSLQGVRFLGMCECAPCEWMDEGFHPGTHAALKDRGGLRAKVLSDGVLRSQLAHSAVG